MDHIAGPDHRIRHCRIRFPSSSDHALSPSSAAILRTCRPAILRTPLFLKSSSNPTDKGETPMNIMVAALGLGFILGNGLALWNGLLQLQQGSSQTVQASQQASPQSPTVQQVPMSPIGVPTNGVQITHGPVVENVTDTTAEIAWSTNVNSGTSLHYGTDPTHLDQTAGMPW